MSMLKKRMIMMILTRQGSDDKERSDVGSVVQ